MTLTLLLVSFASLFWGLALLARRGWSLSTRVLTGLMLGIGFGAILNVLPEHVFEQRLEFLAWTRLIGDGYVSLLKLIVMPLILVSMIAAVIRLDAVTTLGRLGGVVIATLLGTTFLAALLGAVVANVFGLTVQGLVAGEAELARIDVLADRQLVVQDLSLPLLLFSFIPSNIFADLTGARPTSVIAVAVFGILLGIAGLYMRGERADMGRKLSDGVDVVQHWIMALVQLVIGLTPYGVLALMIQVSVNADAAAVSNLFNFIIASYSAIGLMFLVHALVLVLIGRGPKRFFVAAWPALSFAFASRSSMATIPLNVEIQSERMGHSSAIANLSATFGASIGQNGCAGIYPAMLAVMVAPTLGIDPMAVNFLMPLLLVTTLSSLGIAGVGGGATFAALVVLPAMGLPITVVALLISIEPLIDMARTALNVSGAMIAGAVTHRLTAAKAG